MSDRATKWFLASLGLVLVGTGLYVAISGFDLTAPIPSMLGIFVVVLGLGVVVMGWRLWSSEY